MENTCDSFWISVLLCLYCSLGVSGRSVSNQDELIQSLKEYRTIIPTRVTREGGHVSFDTHPEHSVRKRSVANANSDNPFVPELHYSVQIGDNEHILELRLNNRLLSPGIVVERKSNTFKNVTDSRFSYLSDEHKNCHFHGAVVNKSDSKVALGLCNGLHGFIHTGDGEYMIEPLHNAERGPEGEHRHIIYKRSALPVELDPLRTVRPGKESADATCGVKESTRQATQRDRWEQHKRKKQSSSSSFSSSSSETVHHRGRRSLSTERYVETLVVVDPSMIKYHKNEHLETYVLTIMNMVSAMFHDASIGNSINIVLVRIMLLEDEQEELVITHHADKTLASFCKYQKMINFKEDDHPNHHDVAILLTRHNICSRLNEPCSTLGLAQVSGMCQPHRSCNINEDTGLALAYTVTHELGHNFGMHHDGSKNGCEDPPGMQLYIMSPSLVADSLTKTWSNCSKEAVTKFIDRDWGYCLNDEPSDHDYKFPVLPPGTMYDADHQCRLQYGNDEASICTNEQDVCSNLWCRSDNRCSTHLEAAAEGTICGNNQWCYEGKCVKIGDRPEAINGQWGVWSSWTECTRTCGAGISHSQRHCDNPQPSHGGKYCIGERKRYRICNTEDCPDDGVTFNEKQCQEFNLIPYKGRLYEWEHVQTIESPCQLHCKPKNHFFSALLKDIVTDGTPCTPGTRNMCISGRCRHVGCDYGIDSNAREDRCGICHGDGSTCTTIKSQYNESQGLGYVQAAVIPAGARNIRVEEVAAANNFLALQNDKGEYYLNGHWFIQWSGDYKVAGTVVQYKRDGNLETVQAAGPLTEPLHVMLLLQSANPGLVFEYTVPKQNVTEMRVPEFSWQYLTWSHCTSSCGGGSQRSEVVCTEIEAGVVEDKYCNASTKPDDKQRACNEHLCPARWWVGPWQHCSVTCGDDGTHQRTVICVRSLGQDEQIALDDDACTGEKKPPEVELCHHKDACPGTSEWLTGEWSSCNGNMCGMKVRLVTCADPIIGCDQYIIPASEMKCSPVQCGTWATGEWQQCTRTCDEGIQVRKVWCDGSDHCDVTNQPYEHRSCMISPCPPSTTSATTTTNHPLPTTPTLALAHTETFMPAEYETGVKNNDFMSSQEKDSQPKSNNNANNDHKNSVLDKSETELSVNNTDTTENIAVLNVTGTVGSDSEQDMNETEDSDEYYDLDVEDYNNEKQIDIKESEVSYVENTDVDVSVENNNIDDTLFVNGYTKEEGVHKESEIQPDTIDDILEKHKENQVTRHPHRHHHGESIDDKSHPEPIVSSVSKDPVNKLEDKTNSNDKGISDRGYENKAHKNNDNSDDGVDEDEDEEFNDKEHQKKLLSDMKKMSKLFGHNKLSQFPDLENLPPLDTMDLPELPDIRDLRPIPDMKDLPPLDVHKMPPLPEMPEKLPELPKKEPLVNMPDMGSLPKLADLPSLPDIYSKKLSSSDNEKASDKKDDITKHIPLYTHSISKEKTRDSSGNKFDLPQSNDDMNMPVDIVDEIYNANGSDKTDNLVDNTADKNIALLGNMNIESKKSRITPKYDWKTSEWSRCSRECGGGVRTRTVHCVEEGLGVEADPSICNILTRPSAVMDCNTHACLKWAVSEWSQCSATCGYSVKLRQVACPVEGSCESKERPIKEERCNVPKCVTWISGEWSRCSKKCGGGEQVRLIQCVNMTSQLPGRGCTYSDKPEETQLCNTEACEEENAAMEISCVRNEYSSGACRALKKLGQCHKRFIMLKCCATCNQDHVRAVNKDRPKEQALR